MKNNLTKFKSLLVLMIALITCSPQIWATDVHYILVSQGYAPLTKKTLDGSYNVLKTDGTTIGKVTSVSSSITTAASLYYNSTSSTYTNLTKTSNYGASSGDNNTLKGINIGKGKTATINLGSQTFTKIDVIYRCNSSNSGTLTIAGEDVATSSTSVGLKTKTGSFSSSFTIKATSQDYRVVVILTREYSPSYAVTYDANGGSGVAPSDANTYESDDPVTVLGKNTLSKSGYIFAGWNTAANGSGTPYSPGETMNTGAGNVTLHAQWDTEVDFKYVWKTGNNFCDDNSTSTTTVNMISDNDYFTLTGTGVSQESGSSLNIGKAVGNYFLITAKSGYQISSICFYGKIENTNVNKTTDNSDWSGTIASTGTGSDKRYTFDDINSTYFGVKLNTADKGIYIRNMVITIASVAPSCSVPDAPTNLAASVTGTTTATLTITDDAGAASYDIYYNTSSDTPTSGTSATTTSTSKTVSLTSLSVGTTYYAWVRAVCDASNKSAWVALNGSTFTTKHQYAITYDKGTYGSGTIAGGTKTEGTAFTLSSSKFTRAGYNQTGWSLTDGGDKAYDLGGSYTTDAAQTFYPYWVVVPTHSVTAATSTGDNTKGTVSAAASSVAEGGTTTITASPAAGYKVTNWDVSGTGSSISPSGASNSNTTTLTMGTADATVTVTFGDASYGVTYVGSGRSITTGGSSATHGTYFTATFTQNPYYTLRSAITVTIGGNTATQGTEYLWSISNGVGTVTIDGDYITGAIVITVNADANRYDVTLTYDDDEITKVSGATGTNAATYYSNYTATFRAKTGYVLQDDISVTIGGNSATKGSEYSWSVSEGLGTFSVSGSNVIGAIVAEVDADVDDTDYEITYAAGAGVTLTSGNPPSPDSEHKNGESVEIQGNTGNMVYSGYTFRGWTDGTTFYRAGDHVTINGSDIALTAVWDGGTSCTEYEVLLSSGSVTQESSTKPYGQYITGRGKIMRKADGSDATSLSDGSSCHSSTKYFQTGSGVIGLQTYNAINKVTVYATATGNRTLSSIKTGTTLGTYGDDIQGSCTVKVNGSTDTPSSHITWSKDVCGEIEITFPNTLAANTYILVTFSGNLYVYGALFENCTKSNFTVSFNMKGHGSAISSYVGVPTGKKIVAPTEPEATGYTFGRWYRDNSCSNVWNWASSTVTQDTTLYAKWTPNQYAINYYDQGGSAFSGEHSATPPTTHTYGTATTLKSATKSCYTFGGWYTSSDCSTGLVTSLSATGYTADINLYAKWTLTLDVTTEPTTPVAATVGSASSISMAAAGASSYQWQICDDDEGTNATDITGSDTEYSNYTTNTLSFTPASAGTYYLRCKITDACSNNDYTRVVTVNASEAYDVEKGSYTNGSITISPASAGAGTSISISATPDDNYVFKNWTIHKKGDASTTVTPSLSTSASTSFSMPAYDVTVNATFVATHTLTVNVSGGVGGSVSPTSTTVGETLTQSITATPSTGYNFTSWEVSGTGSTLSSTSANPTTFTMGTANATVTATFGAKTYSITLDAGNGTGGSGSVTMTYKSASHTSITAPTLTGYSLVGWYTGEGGTGTMIMNASGTLQASVTGYTDGSGNWTKDATCTLYAKWTANYPDGYLYITDVKSTPETKAGYTITMGKNSANYGTELASAFQTNRAGYEHWAYTSGSSGDITLSFSDALAGSATAGGMIIDVWWGAEDNRTTSITLNGGDAASLDVVGSSSDRNQVRKATYTTDLKSLSSVKLTCSGGKVVWFRVGIKEIPGYLLTYDDGDGSGAPSAEYKPNATITLSSTAPTRSGYIFRGWQVGGSGTVYQPGDEFSMPAEAVTLVAKWTAVCMSFTAATSGSKDVAAGTTKEISTASGGYASTLSGGSMSFYGRVGKIGNNDTYGLVFDSKDDELLTVTLSGAMLEAGAIIVLDCYSVNTNSTEVGFTISGNACAEGNYTTTAKENQRFTRTYVVTEDDGIDGTSSFTIEGATTNKIYLKGMQIAGCSSCTGINPTLTYSATTLYLEPETITASPTLNKDGSTGTVTYSSSNTSVATVNPSTGVVTPVAAGTATIRAHIAYDETHCPTTATCNITVVACGVMPVASAVLTSNSAANEYNATAVISGLSGSQKLNDDGGKFGMTVTGDSPFKDGDIINITGTMDADPTTTTFAVYSSSTASSSSLIYTTTLSAGAAINVEIEVTGDILTALNTSKTVAVIRTKNPSDGQYNQNPHMAGIYLKRYSCSDGIAEYTGAGDNSNWSNTDNWTGGKLPTISDRAIVKKPIIVNVTTAVAKEVFLMQNSTNTGQLEIEAAKALVVAETVKKYNGSSVVSTDYNDIYIHSSASGTGALVMGDHDGTNQATVEFYSLGRKNNEGKKVYQYIGTPFNDVADAQYNYYGSWMYRWDAGSYSWTKMSNGMPVVAFMGYSIAQPSTDPRTYWMQGTLVSSDNVENNLLRHEVDGKPYENMFANSWMAPISLAAMDEEDFVGADATIYIFNAGSDDDNKIGGGGWGSSAGQTTAVAGQYTTAPINSSGWMAVEGNQLTVIPSMQAFSVAAPNSGNATLKLNYSKHVLTPALTSVSIQPNRAPGRRNAASSRPPMLRLFVNGESFGDQLWMFMRNDFSLGFDNGYDGRKLVGDSKAPQLYATTPDGNMAIHCTPAVDGTILGFKPGQDASYTFSFIYDGDETLYLNDLKTETSTLIREGNTYNFTYEDGDAVNRFMISATPFAKTTPTGIEDADWNGTGVQKVIYKDHMYIIRGGRVFDATGGLVK